MAKKSIAILGLGRFGRSLIEELVKHHVDIIALDTDEENVTKAAEMIDSTYICDATNESALKKLGVQNVDHAVVAFGSNIQATIITTIILKEFNIPKITVRIDDDLYVEVMKKLGATHVIQPQKIAGTRLANKLVSDTFMDYFNISKNEDYAIVEISVKDCIEPITIEKLNPRNNFDVNILLIQRGNHAFPPKGTDLIMKQDELFIFGHVDKIAKFDYYINHEKKH